jgi:choline-glycine betaine transporter
MQGWTAFYWAWWISWSPFVGMFIARVSAAARCANS